MASPLAQQVKNSAAMQETQEMQVRSLGQEDPFEEEVAAPIILVPETSQGQRSPTGYSYGVTRVGHSEAHRAPFSTAGRQNNV